MRSRWLGWLGVFLLWSGTLSADVTISEFMARNGVTLADGDRAYVDWIELHNSGTAEINLEGWYLTDTSTNLTKWRFPSQTLAADGYLVVFASGKNRSTGGILHTNFKLSSGGSYLALVQPDGQTIATEFAPAYPPQMADVSCAPNPDPGGSPVVYFETPTPRLPNSPAWPSRAGPVDFSRPGGLFTDPFTLALTTASPGGYIRYTLDGSAPTTNSLLYIIPFTVDRTLRVRARVFRAGQVPGPIEGAAYTQVGASLRTFSSNLPQIIVDTHSRDITEGTRAPCYVTLIGTNGGRATFPGAVEGQSRAGIEVRGSSSIGFPKHSYGLELTSETGADQALSLLGLPADSDWVLYAPYTDKTLLRDVLAYELSNRIGRYAPRTRFVELYVNRTGSLETADYQGVYVLVEKLKGGPDRVDITEVEATDYAEPDVTGGYLLKKDRLESTDAPFTTSHGQQLGFEWPKPRELGATQTQWLKTFLNRFETALYGAGYRDPVAGYAAYVDAGSFVDHFWLVEVAKNIDGFRLSTFMHKDRRGRLNMGPIWDYNLTFGNADYADGYNPTGWYSDQLGDPDYPWYRRLLQDPDFAQRRTDRWASLRTGVLTTSNVLALVTAYTNQLAEAQDRNFKKWPILGTYVWPNYFIGATYEEEVGFLKQWTTDRLAWIDTTVVAWPRISRPSGYYPGGLQVTLTAANPIYFTVDGSDPRQSGGSLSPRALRYTAPLELGTNARVIARARNGSKWSPPVEATYAVTIPEVRITELMYHPAPPPSGSPYGDEEFEFVELRNVGSTPVNLAGFQLSGGIQFTCPADAGDLWPGENVVIVRNHAAFEERYGRSVRLLGPYSSRLDNTGEQVVLTGPFGEPILDFSYRDKWHPTTDGSGYSLTIREPRGAAADWNQGAAWKPSVVPGGTPGRNDVPAVSLTGLNIAQQDGPGGPWLELEFAGAAGQTYSLQGTADLLRGAWNTLTNLPPADASGPVRLAWPEEAAASHAFRVVTPRLP